MEIFIDVAIIIGACFVCVAAFCNMFDDLSFYSGYKVRITILIRNIFIFILVVVCTTLLILGFVNEIRHPENQVKTLKMRVDDAQERLENYLEKHPEFKENK